MSDYLTRGLSKEGHIMGTACLTTNLVEEARKLHDLWPVASAALGRTMSAGAMMANQLKEQDAKLEIIIDGGGPLGKITVDARPEGTVRGYVENPHVNFEEKPGGGFNVGAAVGKQGTLRVIKDIGLKDPFVGTVDLQTGEIGDDLAYYFAVSEQVASAVGVGVLVNPDYSVKSAGGWIIQVMPEATDEEITALEQRVKQMRPVSALLDEGVSPQEILKMLIPDYVEEERVDLSWKCFCSREKCRGVLEGIKLSDLKEIIDEDKKADMKCEFCGTNYHFDEKELQEIYNERVNKIAASLHQQSDKENKA